MNGGMPIRPPPPENGPLAAEVYRRMVVCELTQIGLARKAGLNETYVRDLFRGKSLNPKQAELAKLAAALGCTVTDLTSPGRSRGDDKDEKLAKTAEELMILRIWRVLGPEGRNRLVGQAAELVGAAALAALQSRS